MKRSLRYSLKVLYSSIIILLYFSCTQKHPAQVINTLPQKSDSIINDVSLVALIANPQHFAGQKIRTIGFLHLEFEGNCLYIHKDDYDQQISKNALWVGLKTRSAMDSLKNLSDHYVIIEGIFDKNQGHMDANSGSIQNITRLEIWP